MSSTVIAPWGYLGEGGDYPIEVNFAVRVYDDKGEVIPPVGEVGYSTKGGLRTNRIGIVPLLDGKKEEVGKVEVLQLIAAKPENIGMDLLRKCGFETVEEARQYVECEHGEEFGRDGVITIFVYKVLERH